MHAVPQMDLELLDHFAGDRVVQFIRAILSSHTLAHTHHIPIPLSAADSGETYITLDLRQILELDSTPRRGRIAGLDDPGGLLDGVARDVDVVGSHEGPEIGVRVSCAEDGHGFVEPGGRGRLGGGEVSVFGAGRGVEVVGG